MHLIHIFAHFHTFTKFIVVGFILSLAFLFLPLIDSIDSEHSATRQHGQGMANASMVEHHQPDQAPAWSSSTNTTESMAKRHFHLTPQPHLRTLPRHHQGHRGRFHPFPRLSLPSTNKLDRRGTLCTTSMVSTTTSIVSNSISLVTSTVPAWSHQHYQLGHINSIGMVSSTPT